MYLPLIAVLLLAGPAKAPAPVAATHHHYREARTLTASGTTVASPETREKKASADHGAVAANKPTHTAAATTTTGRGVNHGQTTSSPKTGRQLGAVADNGTTTTTSIKHVALPQHAPVKHIASAEKPARPSRVPLGTFMVTCYDLYGYTADGAVAGPESVAVDPSVIPLGTEIYVPGIGNRTADDTGGMIIGNHIDIWEATYGQCANWGVRYLPIYRVG